MAELPDVDALAVGAVRARVAEVRHLADDAERVRGDGPRPPYPMVVLGTTTAGDDGDLRWRVAPELLVEAWGDPDGRPGKAALREVLYDTLAVLASLPEQDYGPGEAVVTNVASSAGGGWSPDPTGQPRWVAAVRITAHPATRPVPEAPPP